MDMEIIDVPLLEFGFKLSRDAVFRDYFNKFCCLPVFGQRLSFLHKRSKFVYDPPPLKERSDVHQVPHDHVRHWLWQNRLDLFHRSQVLSEMNLCHALVQVSFVKKRHLRRRSRVPTDGSTNDTEQACWLILDDLKRKHLSKVYHMRRFMHIVETSKEDSQLIKYWLDVDYMQRHKEGEVKKNLFRSIQKNFFMKHNQSCLPYYLLNKVYPLRKSTDQYGFDMNATLLLKRIIFHKLHSYWLPKYLMTCKNVSVNHKMFLRKLELLKSLRREEQLIEEAIQRSSVARHIPDPDLKYRLAAKRAKENRGLTVYDDEEESHNILVKKETKIEIWNDEEQLEAGRLRTEMLGSEDVEYIHDHIFTDEQEEKKKKKAKKKERKSKRKKKMGEINEDNDAEKYTLFPGGVLVMDHESHSASTKIKEIRRSRSSSTAIPKSRKKHSLLKKHLSDIDEVCESSTTTKTKQPLSPIPSKSNIANALSSLERDQSNEQATKKSHVSTSSKKGNQIKSKNSLQLPDTGSVEKTQKSGITKREMKSLFPNIKQKKRGGLKRSTSAKVESARKRVSFDSPALPPITRKTKSNVLQSINQLPSSESEYSSEGESDNSLIFTSDENSSEQTETITTTTTTETSVSVSSTISSVKEESVISSSSVATTGSDYQNFALQYLKRVVPDLRLSEILSSDEVAAFPFRSFLMTKERRDENENELDVEEQPNVPTSMNYVDLFDFWRKIEKLRVGYFKMESTELQENSSKLIEWASEHHCFHWISKVTIEQDQPFPRRLQKLQRKLETVE